MRGFLGWLLLIAAIPTAQAGDDLPVPSGYVRQTLKLTDGQALMPADWHFAEGASPGGWTWILSKEDSTKGPYLTGMKIQILVGLAAANHQTPTEFVEAYLGAKRKSGMVIEECSGQEEGAFVRYCMETIEDLDGPGPLTPFHIIYSFHVPKQGDFVVASTFGAPADTWETVKDTATVMGTFRFVGPNFGKGR